MRSNSSKITLGMFLLTALLVFVAYSANAKDSDYIWPNPAFVTNAHMNSPGIPKVESVKVCMKKYGPNDWRTWRAQYFENRLALPDDPYRYEHTSFHDAFDRGMLCNIWTGTPVPMWGMDGESHRLILYPLTGSESQQFSSAAIHKGEGCDIHSHYAGEDIVVVWHGQGEIYLFDSWIPVTAGDLAYVPEGCPVAWRVPADGEKDMVLFIIDAPCPMSEYIKGGLLMPDKSENAKKAGWEMVWKWKNPSLTGLIGNPDYIRYPGQR